MSVPFNFRDTIPFIILGQAPISEKANAQQCPRTDPLVVHQNTSLRGESMCAYLIICGHGDVPLSMQGNIMQCLLATLAWVIFITHISLNRLFACWAHVDKIIHLGSKPCFCCSREAPHFRWHQRIHIEPSIQLSLVPSIYLSLHLEQKYSTFCSALISVEVEGSQRYCWWGAASSSSTCWRWASF